MIMYSYVCVNIMKRKVVYVFVFALVYTIIYILVYLYGIIYPFKILLIIVYFYNF